MRISASRGGDNQRAAEGADISLTVTRVVVFRTKYWPSVAPLSRLRVVGQKAPPSRRCIVFLPATGVTLVTCLASLSASDSVILSVAVPYAQVTPSAVVLSRNLVSKWRMVVMLGRTPVNDAWLKCHGSVAFLMRQAAFTISVLMSTLVMAPIRVLSTLGMVLEWYEPSSVTWHLIVTVEDWNSSLDQVTLNLWLLISKFLAEAVLSAPASSNAAMSAVMPSLTEVRMKNLSL